MLHLVASYDSIQCATLLIGRYKADVCIKDDVSWYCFTISVIYNTWLINHYIALNYGQSYINTSYCLIVYQVDNYVTANF